MFSFSSGLASSESCTITSIPEGQERNYQSVTELGLGRLPIFKSFYKNTRYIMSLKEQRKIKERDGICPFGSVTSDFHSKDYKSRNIGENYRCGLYLGHETSTFNRFTMYSHPE